jgi:outer membrane protein assembly factor BamE (lipoprotein component of BamABCDE complex)
MRGQRIPMGVWLVCVLLASGCVSSGNPSVVDQDRISQIKLDISTKEDVRRILGQPNGISRQSGSYSPLYGVPALTSLTNVETWNYTHINVDVDAATFIPIVGLFAGGATSNVNTFMVVFDDKGIVRHISSTQAQGRSGLGAGGGIAPYKTPELVLVRRLLTTITDD